MLSLDTQLAKLNLCTKSEVASFNGCRNIYLSKKSQNFWDAPLTQPPANIGSKVVLASNSPYPSGIKNKFVVPVRL